MSDERIAYGVRCVWWDSIAKVGHIAGPSGHTLPACPHCGGVLYEMRDEATWWAQVERTETLGEHPGYRKFITWLRGQCFVRLDEAVAAYRQTGGDVKL